MTNGIIMEAPFNSVHFTRGLSAVIDSRMSCDKQKPIRSSRTMNVDYVSVLLDNDVLQSENECYYIIMDTAVKLLRQLLERQSCS